MVGITEVLFVLISGPRWRNEAKQTQSLLRRAESAEKQFCNDRNARSARRVLPRSFSFYPADLSRSAWIIYTDPRDSKSNSCFFFFFWHKCIYFPYDVGRRFSEKKKMERSDENYVYCRLVSRPIYWLLGTSNFTLGSHLNSITHRCSSDYE